MGRRRAAPQTIAFLGDTHCGSHFGLWPEEDLPPSAKWSGVRYLNECFDHLLAAWPEQLDLLVLMGDLIDGNQRKAEATGLFTASLGEQVDGAIRVLAPIAKRAKKIIRVTGTEYHEGYHRALEKLDLSLGVRMAAQVIDVDLSGQILNIAHHPSGGSALYLGTKTDRESLWSMIAEVARKVPPARWIVRAHLHEYHRQEGQHRSVVLTPGFKLQDHYAKKGNYFRWQPSLGGLLMLRAEDYPGGYNFKPTLYDPPMPAVHQLAEL